MSPKVQETFVLKHEHHHSLFFSVYGNNITIHCLHVANITLQCSKYVYILVQPCTVAVTILLSKRTNLGGKINVISGQLVARVNTSINQKVLERLV